MVRSIKLYKSFDIKNHHKKSIILIGNFDGLHLGHQKLFKLANKYKKKFYSKTGVLTFEPMPKMFFNPQIRNFRISNQKQKINLLKKFNVDFVIIKRFDRKFSKTKSTDFIKKILEKKLKAKFIFVSNNFRFGNKREGNVYLLKNFEKKFNYKIINPKPLKKNFKVVSSSLIRKYLSQGKVGLANKCLNRNWAIQGIVESGRKMGKKIGFPTCNISLRNYVIPMLGVYKVRVFIGKNKKALKGIANLGYRPTFNQKKNNFRGKYI